jgi:hypothetical protein
MDYETIKKENQLLKDENERLKNDLIQIKEHLKKYTAPEYKKVYYENNKEEIKQKIKEYRQNNQPTEEQKKKWARTAYLKKKEGMKQEKEKLENQNI